MKKAGTSKPNLPPPTRRPGTDLHVDQVCRILEVGAKSGVKELNFLGLRVVYGQPVVPESPTPTVPSLAPTSSDLTEIQHQALSEASLERDEVVMREEQLAEFLVTDPLRYEQMLTNGDLTDGSSELNDDSLDDSVSE